MDFVSCFGRDFNRRGNHVYCKERKVLNIIIVIHILEKGILWLICSGLCRNFL